MGFSTANQSNQAWVCHSTCPCCRGWRQGWRSDAPQNELRWSTVCRDQRLWFPLLLNLPLQLHRSKLSKLKVYLVYLNPDVLLFKSPVCFWWSDAPFRHRINYVMTIQWPFNDHSTPLFAVHPIVSGEYPLFPISNRERSLPLSLASQSRTWRPMLGHSVPRRYNTWNGIMWHD